jgi:hypothetical protein
MLLASADAVKKSSSAPPRWQAHPCRLKMQMPYTYILSLLDTQIDLLRHARWLLTAPEPLIRKPQTTQSKAGRAAAFSPRVTTQGVAQGGAVSSPESPEPDPAPSVITLIPPRRARRSGRVQPVKRPTAAISALSGPAPAGAFFVPAAQARSLEAQREELRSAGQNAASSSAATPLTAEALARSWMVNSRL